MFKELYKSIKEKGQLEPILVKRVGPWRYQLIDGKNRLRICRSLKRSVDVVTLGDYKPRTIPTEWIRGEAPERALNPVKRVRVTNQEMAKMVRRILKRGTTLKELAKITDRSERYFKDLLREHPDV